MSKIMDLLEDKLNNGQNVTIMMLGDSITYGMYYCNSEETYCACLTKMLADNFPNAEVVRYDGIVNKGSAHICGYEAPVILQKGTSGKLTVVK